MSDIFHIPLNASVKQKKSLLKTSFESVVQHQLNTPAAWFVLIAAAAFIAYATGVYGITAGAALLAVTIAVPVLYGILAFSNFGVILLLLMAYLLFAIMKLGLNFPAGTLMDALQWLLIFGFFIKQRAERNWKIFKGPISILILIWLCYNLMEVANPAAASRMAWVYTVRTVAVVMLMYFIFMYHIRTITFIRLILKIWLALTLIGALYGLKQEYIGFSRGEEAYLHSDPNIIQLLFIDGHWRKFSFFSDPVAFSYNMAVSSILCMVLITGPLAIWKKFVLAICATIYLWAKSVLQYKSATQRCCPMNQQPGHKEFYINVSRQLYAHENVVWQQTSCLPFLFSTTTIPGKT